MIFTIHVSYTPYVISIPMCFCKNASNSLVNQNSGIFFLIVVLAGSIPLITLYSNTKTSLLYSLEAKTGGIKTESVNLSSKRNVLSYSLSSKIAAASTGSLNSFQG